MSRATSATPAPVEYYFPFDGVQVGDISNDGTGDIDYATSINRHKAASAGNGLFRNGATSGSFYADLDSAYDPVNGLEHPNTPARPASAETLVGATGIEPVTPPV